MSQATVEQLRRSAVSAFAHCLVTAAQNRMLHRAEHASVLDTFVDLIRALQEAQRLGVEMPLQLQVSDDLFFHDGVPLDGASLQARALLRCCAERQVAALAFAPEVTAEELDNCLGLLLDERNRDALSRTHRDRVLRAFGIRRIAITLRIPGDPGDRLAGIAPAAGDPEALRSYQDLAEVLHDSHRRAQRDLALPVDAANGIVERTVAQLGEPSGLLDLAAQDNVDRFTVGHSVRVALLALQVAKAAQATRDQLVTVGTAALLHDIGKSKVPQEILFKQARLSPEEWRWMAMHPRLGAEILMEQDHLDPSVVGAAFCHHMRPCGGGYPRAALPMQPSGTSRLVRICDVFEALTSMRPYKRALSPFEAYAVMRRDPGDFDQRWLRLFIDTLGLYPQGSRVALDDGSQAIVLHQTRNPNEPVVRLLSGPDDRELAADTPDVILIGQRIEGRVRRIGRIVTHDRLVAVPEFDAREPEILTMAPQHACLPGRHPPTP